MAARDLELARTESQIAVPPPEFPVARSEFGKSRSKRDQAIERAQGLLLRTHQEIEGLLSRATDLPENLDFVETPAPRAEGEVPHIDF